MSSRTMFGLGALLLAGACLPSLRSSSPQAPSISVFDDTDFPILVVAKDDSGHVQTLGVVEPLRSRCWAWPFRSERGLITISNEGYAWHIAFVPWQREAWAIYPERQYLDVLARRCSP